MLREQPVGARPGSTCVVAADARSVRVGARCALPLDADGSALHANFHVPNLHRDSSVDTSDRVRLALQKLHAEYRFARIEFPCRGGLGFRAVQAKRAGLAFADVTLAVRLDACAASERDREQRWPTGYTEIEGDFAERFAFEHADERLESDPDLSAFVRRLGWSPAAPLAPAGGEQPLVTIGIAHYNLGRYLPETLASLAAQTYPHLEVIVIDDGSTDAASLAVFERMQARYPRQRFLRQANAGIGATRNRCLELARGEFFIPADADNIAHPEMVERFVAAITRNAGLAAMTCYFLAFEDGAGNPPREFLYAYRPPGGPHVLACIRNVYGDANAIFRTASLRAVGGYETDRGTSCEDWEAFVKLAHAGMSIGVVPEHLFYYRHLSGGFSRRTNWFANHNRVLRQFTHRDAPPPADPEVWTALLGLHQELERLKNASTPRRHRIADALHGAARRLGAAGKAAVAFMLGKAGAPTT